MTFFFPSFFFGHHHPAQLCWQAEENRRRHRQWRRAKVDRIGLQQRHPTFRPDPRPSPWTRILVPRGRLRLCEDGPSRCWSMAQATCLNQGLRRNSHDDPRPTSCIAGFIHAIPGRMSSHLVRSNHGSALSFILSCACKQDGRVILFSQFYPKKA